MFNIGASERYSRLTVRLGAMAAIVVGLASTVANKCVAEPAAEIATANFCKVPSPAAGIASGFGLLCGKRVPTGVFLGAFLSSGDDPVGDCVKRCAADDQCQAFSLDSRKLPAGRACTLFGSAEGIADQEAWVSGVRLSSAMGRLIAVLLNSGLAGNTAAGSSSSQQVPTTARPTSTITAQAGRDEKPSAWSKSGKGDLELELAKGHGKNSTPPTLVPTSPPVQAGKAGQAPPATEKSAAAPGAAEARAGKTSAEVDDEDELPKGYAKKASKRPPTIAEERAPQVTSEPSPPPLPRPPTPSVSLPPANSALPPNVPLAPSNSVALTPDMKKLQPVFFATDRTPAPAGAAIEASFTDGRDATMRYGQAIVSIPIKHQFGNVERPKFRLLRLSVEPETDADHFRIKALTPLDRDAFVNELKGEGTDSVLLFIHGYNVSFADAVFKAAQIAYDANFPGTVVVFSWPSAGDLPKYEYDADSAKFSTPHLAQMFSLLSSEIGKKNVYVVAHSMGNQVVVSALVQAALSNANLAINELVMAAPDVDKDVFSSAVSQIQAMAKFITLYASSVDKALMASGGVAFDTRIGFVGPQGPLIFPGVEVIDVTNVGDDMFGLNHGTFASSRPVLDDIGRLIRSLTHLEPEMRTPELRLMTENASLKYWLYPR